MSDLIDRQTAIDLVRDVCNAIMSGCESWYDPEVEGEVYKDIHEVAIILKCNKEVRIALRNMPSAEPVVRCRDCENWMDDYEEEKSFDRHYCAMVDHRTEGSWFCADGEKKDGKHDGTD